MKLQIRESNSIATSSPITRAEMISKFINDQDVKLSSKKTYERGLRQFWNWVDDLQLLPSELERNHILKYKNQLLLEGKAALTVGGYLVAVRKFYEWAEGNKFYPNIAKGIKTPRRANQFRKRPLHPEQVTVLLGHMKQQSLRDYALINLIVRTGLRTIETTTAQPSDIVLINGKRVLRIQGKGRNEKDNFVVLTDKAYEPIQELLSGRKMGYIFESCSNRNTADKLSTRTVSRIAKEALKAIGIDEKAYTAHSLRHTFGTNILRGGGTMEQAQFALRHTNPATTQIYTAFFNEENRLKNSGESIIDDLY